VTAAAAPAPRAGRSRRTAVDRRAQLVGIGLELLPTTPVQELTIDEVARRAGISRSLLFHYFPSKRDYYTAVTRAAAELLEQHLVPGGAPQAGELPGMVDRFVGWVDTYREAHLSVVRGAAGGDPWVAEVYEETRERLVDVALAALGLPGDALRRQLVRAWFSFAEDLVGQWAREPAMPRPALVALLLDVLDRLVVASPPGSPDAGRRPPPAAAAGR
jgi:AcrR family transcriptional regulator